MTYDCCYIRVEELVDEGVICRSSRCPRNLWSWETLDRLRCRISVDDSPLPEGVPYQHPEAQQFEVDEPFGHETIIRDIVDEVDRAAGRRNGMKIVRASAVHYDTLNATLCDVGVAYNEDQVDVETNTKLFGLVAELHRGTRLCEELPWEVLQLTVKAGRGYEIQYCYAESDATLRWQDVAKKAEHCFTVWNDQPELAWAELAWSALIDGGLANYRTEAGQALVSLRLLTLVLIYHDWCHVACDERFNYDNIVLGDWCGVLGLNPHMFAGMMLEITASSRSDDETLDDDEWRLEGIQLIKDAANSLRPEVVRALLQRFGGENGLFASLVRSSDPDASDTSIFDTATANRVDGYDWVQNACPVIQ
jgi:hypothetical protein